MDYTLNRKDSLILSTIDVIDELGIQRLLTREIAKREGVSEATLFRHYKNKNDLLAAVLDYFSKYNYEIYLSIKIKDLEPKEAIISLVGEIAKYYENYPAITAIMQNLDTLKYERDLTVQVNNIINRQHSYIQQMVEEALHKENRKTEDAEKISLMISGLFREICLKWRFENMGFSLKEMIMASVTLLLNALCL